MQNRVRKNTPESDITLLKIWIALWEEWIELLVVRIEINTGKTLPLTANNLLMRT